MELGDISREAIAWSRSPLCTGYPSFVTAYSPQDAAYRETSRLRIDECVEWSDATSRVVRIVGSTSCHARRRPTFAFARSMNDWRVCARSAVVSPRA